MPVKFACRCGNKLRASDENVGKKVLCSQCGSPVMVPAADAMQIETAVAASAAGAAETASLLLRGASGGGGTATKSSTKPKRQLAIEEDTASTGEPGVDYIGALRQFSLVVLPGFIITAFVIVGGYWLSYKLLVGSNLPDLGEVHGVVTLDGNPVSNAKLTFRPDLGPEGNKGVSNSFGKTSATGSYTMYYLQGVPGAVLGKHKVRIAATYMVDGVPTPLRFDNQTGQVAEVKDGDNEINFVLKSPTQ